MPPPVSDNGPDLHTAKIPLTARAKRRGRTFVIGDIHGCSKALNLMLDELSPQNDDFLVTLGDYVDRGPDTRGVIDRLLDLDERTHLIPLLGNHEILMLDARDGQVDVKSWFGVGGRQTMESYGGVDGPDWNTVPDKHWEFLRKRLHRWHTNDTHLFAHANLNAMLPMTDQGDDWLFWRRFDDSHPHFSGRTLVCGHTAQKNGLPNIKPGAICIDTWAYGDGWLTALEIDTQTFVQTNQRGEVRRYSMDDVRKLAEKV